MQTLFHYLNFGSTSSSKYRLPRWHSDKEATCQCSWHKRHGFDPCIRKIPWSRKWQPTPGSSPGKFKGQRSLVGYSPWSCKKCYMTEHTYFSLINIFKAVNFPLPTTLTNSHRFSEVLLSTPNVALKSSQVIRKLFSALSTSLRTSVYWLNSKCHHHH